MHRLGSLAGASTVRLAALDTGGCLRPGGGAWSAAISESEECDDGNDLDGDGCDRACRVERCGDGVLQLAVEQCEPSLVVRVECTDLGFDDGDEVRCDDRCQLDTASCVRFECGDGRVDGAEECDDGNTAAGDGCSDRCVEERCGDGEVQSDLDELCDDGDENSDTHPGACRTTCIPAYCGDGILDPGESCDDGGITPGDGCSAECALEQCGDGAVQPGEGCDSGADNSDVLPDACRTTCQPARCGDGVIDSTDECDDGNPDDGDGCSADCRVELSPVARISAAPLRAAVPFRLTLDGTASSDDDGEVVGWRWHMDGATDLDGSTAAFEVTHAGTVTVRLTVTDDDGHTATSTVDIEAGDGPHLSVVTSATLGCTPHTFTVDASASFDEGAIVAWSWDFGDGATADTAASEHVYSRPGTYSATLTATDDDGFSSSRTWTVGVLDSGPDGAKAFVGAHPTQPTSWWQALNWCPNGVPTEVETIWMSPDAPRGLVYDAGSHTVAGLIVPAGATLEMRSGTLGVDGDVESEGRVFGPGTIAMPRAASQLRGNLGTLSISNPVALAGPLVVDGSLMLRDSGELRVAGFSVDVSTDMTIRDSAALVMTDDDDDVRVHGDFQASGAVLTDVLTAGTLRLHGDALVGPGDGRFNPTGSHVTILEGTAPQVLSASNPSITRPETGYGHTIVRNPAGVVVSGFVRFYGPVEIEEGDVTGATGDAILHAAVSDDGSGRWRVATTRLVTAAADIPSHVTTDVSVNAMWRLTHDVAVEGSLFVDGSDAVLDPSGHVVQVSGQLFTQSLGVVELHDDASVLDAGSIQWGSDQVAGTLEAGRLVTRSYLSNASICCVYAQTADFWGWHPAQIIAEEGVTLELRGLSAASFGGYSSATSIGTDPRLAHYGTVVVDAPGGIDWTGYTYLAGDLILRSGEVTGTGSVTVAGDIIDEADTAAAWRVATTAVVSDDSELPAVLDTRLVLDGASLSASADMQLRALTVQNGGTLSLAGHSVTLQGDLSVVSNGLVQMNDSADRLEVGGDAVFDGRGTAGALTAGEVSVAGDFTAFAEPDGSAYGPTGTHRTRFAGGVAQAVLLRAGSGQTPWLRDVEIATTGDLSFGSGTTIHGDVAVPSSTAAVTGGTVVLTSGQLVNDAGADWAAQLEIDGTDIAFPRGTSGRIDILGSAFVERETLAAGDVYVTGGTLDIRDQTLELVGQLSVTSSGRIEMNDPAGQLIVDGLFDWGVDQGDGLSAGTLHLRGNVTHRGSGFGIRPSGSHTVTLDGSTHQNVLMRSGGVDRCAWQSLVVDNPAGVTFGDAAAVASDVTVRRGDVAGAGTLTIGGDLFVEAGNAFGVALVIFDSEDPIFPAHSAGAYQFTRPVTFPGAVELGGLVISGADTAVVLGASVTTTGDLTIEQGATLEVGTETVEIGGDLAVNSSGLLSMQDPAGVVDVAGDAYFAGRASAGRLVDGTLRVAGNFEARNVQAFAATGRHRTVLDGSAEATLTFNRGGAADQRFASLEVAGADRTITVSGALVSTGETRVGAGVTPIFVGASGATIAWADADVSGAIFDTVPVTLTGAITAFDDVRFRVYAPTATQLAIRGAGGTVTLSGLTFDTPPSSGFYLAATDDASDGDPLTVRVVGATPASPAGHVLAAGGATIDWP
ncbi:MAG: PKD domain-containing protein [Myxococcales bacterium]|nr:PKD domain-containing protein [Myxococcales bacterium]